MDLPDGIRKRLEDFSRNVLFDQSGTRTVARENDTFLPHDKRLLSSLHLQMSLYFNMWFFPLWWISEAVMLHLKYPALPDYYKFILVTVLILMTLIEAIRLFLGYSGNLQEQVPELAGFWLLSILLQFPLILFQLFNEAILIQPLERGVHIVLAIFILAQTAYPAHRVAGGWSPSQLTSGDRQGTPWIGRQPIAGQHRDTQPFTLTQLRAI